MVAVGSSKTGTAAQTVTTQAASASPMPQWTVREGRGTAFALWEDALSDALPKLGLRQENLLEQPPIRPNGEALSVESHKLWTEAVEYFLRSHRVQAPGYRLTLGQFHPGKLRRLTQPPRWKVATRMLQAHATAALSLPLPKARRRLRVPRLPLRREQPLTRTRRQYSRVPRRRRWRLSPLCRPRSIRRRSNSR